MIGFELELSCVLIYKRDGEANWHPTDGQNIPDAVKPFLTKLVTYNHEIGKVSGVDEKSPQFFRLKADGRRFPARGDLLRWLVAQNYLKNNPIKDEYNFYSILEYVTSPVDELKEGFDAELEQQAKMLQQHMTQMLGIARTPGMQQILPPASDGYLVGVPTPGISSWLNPQQSAAWQPLLEKCRTEVEDRIYLQATVGMIPSSVPSLFRNLTGSPLYIQADIDITRVLRDLKDEKQFSEHRYIEEMSDIDRDALDGFLYLAFGYMVFDTIARTPWWLAPGADIKNAVPFLMQMNPQDLPQRTGTIYLRKNRIPDDLMALIRETFMKSEYITTEYWKKTTIANTKNEENEDWHPRRIITANEINASLYTDFINQFFGSGPVSQQIRFVNAHNLPGDELPALVKDQVSGQIGIPLEYRDAIKPFRTDELLAKMQEVVKNARTLNLIEVPNDMKKNLYEQVARRLINQ